MAAAAAVSGAAIIAVSAFTGLRAGESGFVPHYLLALIWIVAVSVNWGFFHGRTWKKTAVAAKAEPAPSHPTARPSQVRGLASNRTAPAASLIDKGLTRRPEPTRPGTPPLRVKECPARIGVLPT